MSVLFFPKKKFIITYNTARDIAFRRQEGDSSDLTVVVSGILPLEGAAMRFQVSDIAGRVLISKSTADSSVSVVGQTIYLRFDPSETKRKAGIHRWELEVTTAMGDISPMAAAEAGTVLSVADGARPAQRPRQPKSTPAAMM